MYAWKYTLPAFIVPFMFILDPKGVGILLKGPAMNIIWTVLTSFIGIGALAAGVENWCFRRTTLYERIMLLLGGLLLVYPSPYCDLLGFGLIIFAIISQKLIKKEAL